MFSKFALKAMLCAVPVAVAAMASGGAQAGAAFQYRVLHDFCKAANCADGAYAVEAPAMDSDGDLYGVTYMRGQGGYGALWELVPHDGGARYYKHVLKGFCDEETADCGSGGRPMAGPVMDVNGNLYGTTSRTDGNYCGTVYEMPAAITAARFKPQLRVLHTFAYKGDACAPNSGSLEYQGKDSGQAYDGTSPLFGMTQYGGLSGNGAVYKLTPPKPGRKKWTETVLYSFCVQTLRNTNCQDGKNPQGNLVMDGSGNLFGATNDGKVFEMSQDGLTFNVLYTSTTGETYTALIIDGGGTLHGVADGGGATGYGTLFSLAPTCAACGRIGLGYQYTLLHDFCAGDCADGAGPNSLVMDASGNIFGTAFSGGTNPAPPNSTYTGAGTVFEYTQAGSFFPLHQFCAQDVCTDGGAPVGGLMLSSGGAMFGTTAGGGSTANVKYGAGTVYELSAPF
jgi:uncharacterized repeat protein (TIGR03803 family)